MNRLLTLASVLFVLPIRAQEQVDLADADGKASSLLSKSFLRVRVTKADPEQSAVHINWRHGGEGLGGNVTRSFFLGPDKKIEIPHAGWSEWYALETVAGRGWSFPTITVEGVRDDPARKAKNDGPSSPLEDRLELGVESAVSGFRGTLECADLSALWLRAGHDASPRDSAALSKAATRRRTPKAGATSAPQF